MKTKPVTARKARPQSARIAKRSVRNGLPSKLPEWVIGVFDGPKDKGLSRKEGF